MQNPPLKFTLRCSSNFSASDAAIVTLCDPQGDAAMLVTPSQFEAAQRLIADLEAQEPHWPEFDRSYAQRLHKPFVGA